jgi:hypothetical protein
VCGEHLNERFHDHRIELGIAAPAQLENGL